MNKARTVVLDTHVWIWLAGGIGDIAPATLQVLQTASLSASIIVPAICVWEVALLERRGRISLDKPVGKWIADALMGPGINLGALTPEICIDSVSLPGNFHKDPADQMIVATARVERAVLVTRDARITEYGQRGYVEVIEA